MKFFLKPLSRTHITRGVQRAIRANLNGVLFSARIEAEERMKALVEANLRRSDFIQEISHGFLRGDFGIRPELVEPTVEAIISTVVDDVHLNHIDVNVVAGKFTGGWELTIGNEAIEKLKNLKEGITITEKGEEIPWLEWTLTVGNQTVIADFKILFKSGTGRSGLAIMIPDEIIGYRVPPRFAGTEEDNWLNRAITTKIDSFTRIVRESIVNNIP